MLGATAAMRTLPSFHLAPPTKAKQKAHDAGAPLWVWPEGRPLAPYASSVAITPATPRTSARFDLLRDAMQ
jgi:hypothetical protein